MSGTGELILVGIEVRALLPGVLGIPARSPVWACRIADVFASIWALGRVLATPSIVVVLLAYLVTTSKLGHGLLFLWQLVLVVRWEGSLCMSCRHHGPLHCGI